MEGIGGYAYGVCVCVCVCVSVLALLPVVHSQSSVSLRCTCDPPQHTHDPSSLHADLEIYSTRVTA